MSKQDTSTLRANAGTAAGDSSTYTGNAQSTFNALTPTLNRLAAGGGGYSPATRANMTTAALQATGGGNAGVVGSALQRASATNNAGGANALTLASAHDATQNLSDAALGVQNDSARLAAQQQMQALGEQGQLYGTSGSLSNGALGLSTQATDDAEKASENGFWRGVGKQAIGNALSIK